ncbi:MAG: hypothetical protein ACJ8AH_10125, partial [Stellaceae bacterium]
ALARIFDAYQQMIELRAAQKLNAGILEPTAPCGSPLTISDDAERWWRLVIPKLRKKLHLKHIGLNDL